jgi:SnoaL-like domain
MDAQDRLEIHELISRYCHILDTRNWADLDKIFLPEPNLRAPLEGRRPGWLNGRFRGSGARRHVTPAE